MKLFEFAYCANFDNKIKYLSQTAEQENWGENRKVLKNYIKHYFRKIYDDDDYYSDDNYFIFNTGLLTKNYEEIFALFIPNKNQDYPNKWFLLGFYQESKLLSQQICLKENLPSLPKFFNSFEDLYFDPSKDIVLNRNHILDERSNRISIPLEILEKKDNLIKILEGEIQTLKKRLARNYRLAVPQYYKGQIQFLLPLKLLSDKVTNSLVVSLNGDNYIAHTIFTLDMAYNNARLLMKPESEWLTI